MTDFCSKCTKPSDFELNLSIHWQFFTYETRIVKGFYCKKCLKETVAAVMERLGNE